MLPDGNGLLEVADASIFRIFNPILQGKSLIKKEYKNGTRVKNLSFIHKPWEFNENFN